MARILLGCSLLALCGALASAQAQTIYKCKDENGTTVFSEQPCGRGAVRTDVRPARGAAPASSVVAPSPTALQAAEAPPLSEGDKLKREAAQASVARRLREIDFAIEAGEKRIRIAQDTQANALESLRFRKGYANNNLAGAVWESSLSQEMEAVARQQSSIIADEREKIRALQAERASLLSNR